MNLPSQTRGLAIARVLLSVASAVLLGLGAWLLAPGDSASTEASVIVLGPTRQVVNEVIKAPLGAMPGSIKGNIQFNGAAPVRPPIYAKGAAPKDPQVCGAVEIVDESLVVNAKNNGIAHVFVYMAKAPAGFKVAPPPAGPGVIFDQKNCAFLPHALLCRTNQIVNVLNSDPIAHNTRTNPIRNNGFNQNVGPMTPAGVVTFSYKKPEKLPVKVNCDFHPWMIAHHLVLDHPFMAVTDANGDFVINGIPAGNHEFIVWQERTGYLDRTLQVTVPAGGAANVNLKYGADKLSVFNGPQPKQVQISFAE